MKIEIFKNKKSFKKRGFYINPDISWEITLCAVFVLVIASFVFNFFLFRQINEEFILPVAVSSGTIKIVKKERIDKVLEYFTERKKNSAEILNSLIPIVDPSL